MTMFTATHTSALTKRTKTNPLGHLFHVWRQRQALRELDAAALRDIGVTRAEANAEANRSFWDAPDSWRM